MDALLETITLDLEESQDLKFKVQIEGTDPAPVKVRLVCEGNNVSYMFTGKTTQEPDVVLFEMPSMKGMLKEGVYLSKVEVLVDDRYFTPVQFQIDFKKTVRVVAESLTVQTRKAKPTVTASLMPVQPVVTKQPLQISVPQKPAVEHKSQAATIATTQRLVPKREAVPVKPTQASVHRQKPAVKESSCHNVKNSLQEKFSSKQRMRTQLDLNEQEDEDINEMVKSLLNSAR
jgi:hypothetical protein